MLRSRRSTERWGNFKSRRRKRRVFDVGLGATAVPLSFTTRCFVCRSFVLSTLGHYRCWRFGKRVVQVSTSLNGVQGPFATANESLWTMEGQWYHWRFSMRGKEKGAMKMRRAVGSPGLWGGEPLGREKTSPQRPGDSGRRVTLALGWQKFF